MLEAVDIGDITPLPRPHWRRYNGNQGPDYLRISGCSCGGSRFREKLMLNDGAPEPKIVESRPYICHIYIPVVYVSDGVVYLQATKS